MGLGDLVRNLFLKSEPRGQESAIDSTQHLLPYVRRGPEESYFERTCRFKDLIESDKGLLDIMRATFEHQYLGKIEPETVRFLGQGSTHIVYRVGSVFDPIECREVHVALRLSVDHIVYDTYTEVMFTRQLDQFEDAFDNKRKQPPYFAGAVLWKGYCAEQGEEIEAYGFLIEDVTENGRYEIEEIYDWPRSDFYRLTPDGKELFLLDPYTVWGDPSEKYLLDEALVTV